MGGLLLKPVEIVINLVLGDRYLQILQYNVRGFK